MAPLRWGFCGTGKIANDFATAIDSLPKSEQRLVAVAARKKEKAEKFAKEFKFEKSYDDYEALATDPDVDVIYVATVNPNHYELCKKLIDAGKHILCEKPLTLLLEHTKKLIELAEKKGIFFQEAVWSRFFPAYERLRAELKSGSLGDIHLVTATLGFKDTERARLVKKDLGGGSLMDIGGYVLQFALQVYGPEMPEETKAVAVMNDQKVDMSVAITLKWSNDRLAQLATSFLADTDKDPEGHIWGSSGSFKLKRFWCPEEITVMDKKEQLPLPKVNHKVEFPHGAGMVYEAQEVKRCIDKGLKESPHFTHKESILISQIETEIKKQIGLSFEDLYSADREKWEGADDE